MRTISALLLAAFTVAGIIFPNVGLARAASTGATPRASLAADSSWPVAGGNPGGTNFNSAEQAISRANVARLHVAWRVPNVRQAIATPTRVFAISAVQNGNSYTQRVLVLDAATGRTLHTYGAAALRLQPTTRALPAGDMLEALAYGQGRLIIAATAEIIAIDPATGHQFWRVPGGAMVLTIANGVVYTGKGCMNPCGAIASYAIDLQTGRVLWTHGGNGGAQPLVAAGRVLQPWGFYEPSTRMYGATAGGFLRSIPAYVAMADNTGSYGQKTMGGGINCRAAAVHYGLQGRLQWKVGVGPCNVGAMALAYNTVYVTANSLAGPGAADTSRVIALDAASGRLRWQRMIGQSEGLAVASHLLFTLSRSAPGTLRVLDAASGKLLRQVVLPAYTAYVPNPLMIAGRTLFVPDGTRLLAVQP